MDVFGPVRPLAGKTPNIQNAFKLHADEAVSQFSVWCNDNTSWLESHLQELEAAQKQKKSSLAAIMQSPAKKNFQQTHSKASAAGLQSPLKLQQATAEQSRSPPPKLQPKNPFRQLRSPSPDKENTAPPNSSSGLLRPQVMKRSHEALNSPVRAQSPKQHAPSPSPSTGTSSPAHKKRSKASSPSPITRSATASSILRVPTPERSAALSPKRRSKDAASATAAGQGKASERTSQRSTTPPFSPVHSPKDRPTRDPASPPRSLPSRAASPRQAPATSAHSVGIHAKLTDRYQEAVQEKAEADSAVEPPRAAPVENIMDQVDPEMDDDKPVDSDDDEVQVQLIGTSSKTPVSGAVSESKETASGHKSASTAKPPSQPSTANKDRPRRSQSNIPQSPVSAFLGSGSRQSTLNFRGLRNAQQQQPVGTNNANASLFAPTSAAQNSLHYTSKAFQSMTWSKEKDRDENLPSRVLPASLFSGRESTVPVGPTATASGSKDVEMPLKDDSTQGNGARSRVEALQSKIQHLSKSMGGTRTSTAVQRTGDTSIYAADVSTIGSLPSHKPQLARQQSHDSQSTSFFSATEHEHPAASAEAVRSVSAQTDAQDAEKTEAAAPEHQVTRSADTSQQSQSTHYTDFATPAEAEEESAPQMSQSDTKRSSLTLQKKQSSASLEENEESDHEAEGAVTAVTTTEVKTATADASTTPHSTPAKRQLSPEIIRAESPQLPAQADESQTVDQSSFMQTSSFANKTLGSAKKGPLLKQSTSSLGLKSLQKAAMAKEKEQQERDRKAAIREEREQQRRLMLIAKQQEEERQRVQAEKKRKGASEAQPSTASAAPKIARQPSSASKAPQQSTQFKPKAAPAQAQQKVKSSMAKPEEEQPKRRKVESETGSSTVKPIIRIPPQPTRPATALGKHSVSSTASQPVRKVEPVAGPSRVVAAGSKPKGPTHEVKPVQQSQTDKASGKFRAPEPTPPPEEPEEPYEELPDIASEYSDSDDDEQEKKQAALPQWAQSPALKAQLVAQSRIDPDDIFGAIPDLKLEDIFKGRKGQFRARTSSAHWTGSDALTMQEEAAYARRMNFVPASQSKQQ